uniref:Protein kinase domain-containing protein n=1 Tax=Timema tahoe TaxID=61484 RepID=A0A7R9NYL0_9NEOP|nr:unnamed protein product [Timema tahoe]
METQSFVEKSLRYKNNMKDALEESVARNILHETDVQDVLEESVTRSGVHITDVQDVLEDVLEESVARSSVHITTDVQDVLKESVARSSVQITTDVQDVLKESVARSSVNITTDVPDVLEESMARSSVNITTDVQDVLEESVARSSVNITDMQDVLKESVARSSVNITDVQDVLEESVARSSVHITDVQDVLEESVARSSVHITDVQDVLEESVARSSIHGTDNCHIYTKKLQSTERKISLEHTPKKTYQPQSPKSMKRKRCTRFVIAGRDSSQKVSRQSIFKDVCCSFNGTFTRRSIDEEGTILKLEPTLSNASVNLPDSPIQSEEVLPSACDVVLSKCHLKRILLFSDAFSFSFLDKCSKIGEGVYGEVFSCEESCSVIKIIPIEGNQLVNGEPQKTFKEILSEIVIAIELSNLRCSQYNKTSAFTEVLRCLCVQGRYPHRLIELWNIYAEKKGTENDSPEMFAEDQLFIILELTHGGTDLEAYHFQSAEQAFSVYQQVAYALAVAECSLEFEHRDLHWGNILISPTRDKISRFCIRGKQIDIATKGVKASFVSLVQREDGGAGMRSTTFDKLEAQKAITRRRKQSSDQKISNSFDICAANFLIRAPII